MDGMNESKRRSGKRNAKRKFTGNMHTRPAKQEILNTSVSSKKIDTSSKNKFQSVCDMKFYGYRIIDINSLLSHLEEFLKCPKCGCNVSMKEDAIYGLLSKFTLTCIDCGVICSFRNSSMIGEKKNISELNRRFMYAARSVGLGNAAMNTFCGVMDLPPPVAAKSYNSMVKKLMHSSSVVSELSMKNSAEEEIKLSESSQITISGDGTWKTRGHSSRSGVCTVIGDQTGKVLDLEVLSTYCKACETQKRMKNSIEFKKWKAEHEDLCLVNHSGSAGKMEVNGMVRIFQRSEEKHGAQYTGYIGDGDTKTFNAICEAKPYGLDIPVKKIECVGHVQKRMGSRLRKMKQNSGKLADGKSLGGQGRLTDKCIDLLAIYYGNAIRENKNSLPDMRKAVWALYFHSRSSDLDPLHSFCPTGNDSWCKYQKASANGTLDNYHHKKTLPSIVMDAIKPIFNDLSHPRLLSRCLGGKTQNANESINALIWKICPKTQGSGKRIVDIAANEAVILFNEGNQGRLLTMNEMQITPGKYAHQSMLKMDEKRVAEADRRCLQNTKDARKAKRISEKAAGDKLLMTEGVTYAAGEF